MLIGSSMYNDGGEPLDIVEAQEGSDSCYTLLFANGAFTTLSDITDNQLTWFSDASGTTLKCARFSASSANSQNFSADLANARTLLNAVGTSPKSKDAPRSPEAA